MAGTSADGDALAFTNAEMALQEKDIYGILNIPENADNAMIKQAYLMESRKKHPDKSDDPNAHEIFIEVKAARDFLLNADKRAHYGHKLKRAREKEWRKSDRARQMNEEEKRRRQFKEDLERFEKEADQKYKEDPENHVYTKIRNMNKIMLEKELELAYESFVPNYVSIHKSVFLKATWKEGNQYPVEVLDRIFSKYGNAKAVTRGKKAIIEFDNTVQAERAVKLETGFPENPLTVTYLKDPNNPKELEKEKKRKKKTQLGSVRDVRQERFIEEILEENRREIEESQKDQNS